MLWHPRGKMNKQLTCVLIAATITPFEARELIRISRAAIPVAGTEAVETPKPTSSFDYIKTIDPATAWWDSVPGGGWFLRYRGIIGYFVIHVLLSGGLAFVQPAVGAVCVVFAPVIAFFFYSGRKLLVANLQADDTFHELTHDIRDRCVSIMASRNEERRSAELQSFHEYTVQKIAEYFRIRAGDASVNCCIRIAEGSVPVRYCTVARSNGLVRERKETTEPILETEGIAAAFFRQKCLGAYLIRDLARAVQDGIWKLMENDRLDDAKYFLVCPINGWDGDSKSMLGLFFLTARKNSLTPAHWLAQKGIADLLGLVYPLIYRVPSTSRAHDAFLARD